MAKINLFVTGTDTGIGKTRFSVDFLRACQQASLVTAALKPLASGADLTSQGLRNEDALQLQAVATSGQSYESVNPMVFQPPIAPHIAAAQQDITLTIAGLLDAIHPIWQIDADVLLIEGCGGWLCPLNEHETLADFVGALQIPVILVVGLRLGCLNHALLTWRSIFESSVSFAGWVANVLIEDETYAVENIKTLTHYFGVSPLVVMPYC